MQLVLPEINLFVGLTLTLIGEGMVPIAERLDILLLEVRSLKL